MKYLFLAVLLSTQLSFAHPPDLKVMAGLKADALKNFNADAKVSATIKDLVKNGYVPISVDMVPYHFVYGDEGAIANFLVTAWYSKSEKYGWSSKFVTAKVGTDHWGWHGAILLDSDAVEKTITDLK